MPTEQVLVSRRPSNREESGIQLVTLTDMWPPLDQAPAPSADPAHGGHVQPMTPDLGPVLPRQFAILLVECLAGVRPARQLMPWLSKRGSAHLHRLTPLFAADGQQPRVLRVLAARPIPDVIEMTLVVMAGTRTRALAARLERGERTQQWLCTDIEAA
ncbi:MAG: Rv3235 family protein [Trebonia sp.]